MSPSLSKCIRTFAVAISLASGLSTRADDPGRVILEGARARTTGERLAIEKATGVVVGSMRASDKVEWDFRIDRPGWYQVVVHYALATDSLKGAAAFEAEVGDQSRLGPIHATGAIDRYLPQVLFDPIELTKGDHRLSLSVKDTTRPVDLRIKKVELVRAREPGKL